MNPQNPALAKSFATWSPILRLGSKIVSGLVKKDMAGKLVAHEDWDCCTGAENCMVTLLLGVPSERNFFALSCSPGHMHL